MNMSRATLMGLVGAILTSILYLVWNFKIASLFIFILVLLAMRWRPKFEVYPEYLSLLLISTFGLFPLVYLLSFVGENTQRGVVSVFYIPVILTITNGVVADVYDQEKSGYSANLMYLYFVPFVIFLPLGVAYSILALYGVTFLFGWEKYFLKEVPAWERVVHIIGLTSILLAITFYLQ